MCMGKRLILLLLASANVLGNVTDTNLKETHSSFASKFSTISSTKAMFRKIEEQIPKDTDYDVDLPIDSVFEVNEWLKNSLYGYLIGKRHAFPVVDWFVRINWKKYCIVKATMNANDFFFLRFSSTDGAECVLRDGPWMIRGIPIFLTSGLPR